MGCFGYFSNAGPDYISTDVIWLFVASYSIVDKKIPNRGFFSGHKLPVMGNCYTINGRFSSVPSDTRTFTSSIINIVSGVCDMFELNISVDNK